MVQKKEIEYDSRPEIEHTNPPEIGNVEQDDDDKQNQERKDVPSTNAGQLYKQTDQRNQ